MLETTHQHLLNKRCITYEQRIHLSTNDLIITVDMMRTAPESRLLDVGQIALVLP